ncbi:MAG: hypothetical protein ACTS6G_04895 [Candidatus Hodgkinia cicadicola]
MYSLCKALTKALRRTRESSIATGQLVRGVVKFKTEAMVLIDVGRTMFGVLPNFGIWNFRQLKVGDSVEAYVEEVGGIENGILLSRRHLDEEEAWSAVLSAWRNRTAVEAEVVALTRGGIEMRVFNLPAGLIWDSEAVERIWNFPVGEMVLVEICYAVREFGLIVLSLAKASDGGSKDFELNTIVWGEIIGPLPRGYHLNVCGLSAVLTFESTPCWENLRFMKVARAQQLVLVNVRKRSSAERIESNWNVTELARMSVQIVEEMKLADEMLINEMKVGSLINSLRELNVSPCERYFDAGETKRLKREWAIADREWERGLKRGWLQTNERPINRKRSGLLIPSEELFNEMEQTLMEGTEGSFNELNWIPTEGITTSLRERSFAQMDRSTCKRDALTCGWEQTKWMEFIKAEANGSANVKCEIKLEKEEGTFDEWDWDENEMYFDDEETEDELPDFEYENFNNESEVELKCENDEEIGSLTIEEKLLRNWKDGLNVNELRLSAVKVFGGKRREREVFEVNLAVNSFERTSRSIRSIYGVIVGLDLQSKLIVMEASDDIVALVAEASFTTEDTYLFAKNAANGSGAIKMLPLAFCPFTACAVVEIDVEGFRLLKFIEAYGFGPFVGSIARIEHDGFIIALNEGMWGKLSAKGDCFADCECVNAEVLVSICDVNVVTNTLNLEFVEDEEMRTALEEVN